MSADTREMFADADLTHPWVERYRIPLVSSPWPQWKYEVAVVRPNDEPYAFWSEALWPSEDEARLIGCAIDYRRDWYNDHWASKMLLRALDVDSGTNTVILLKLPRGWVYRRATYQYGPPVVPSFNDEKQYPELMPLLDRIWDLTDHWANWKRDHWAAAVTS